MLLTRWGYTVTDRRVFRRCLVSGYLLWSLPACNVPPPPPDQALLSLVQNTAEWSTDNYSYFLDPKLIDKIQDIHDATNRAFEQVARIKLDFPFSAQSTILSPFPAQAWPTVDPTDSQYPQNFVNERWYETWVRDHRNANVAFGAFWVEGPATSHGTFCGPRPKILGITLNTTLADNDVTTQATSRGSVMFAGWIYRVAQCSGFSSKPAINFYIRAHTHELGHQRADLTHPEQNSGYHNGPVPTLNQGRDVMAAEIIPSDLNSKVPIFDQHFEQAQEGFPCIHLTCQDNLICWRSITN